MKRTMVWAAAVVLTLTLTPSAKAQVYWGSRYYYNPWTGGGVTGGSVYNPWTGGYYQGGAGYNAWTGRYYGGGAYYNPYTGMGGTRAASITPGPAFMVIATATGKGLASRSKFRLERGIGRPRSEDCFSVARRGKRPGASLRTRLSVDS
jgi:hypothetical protein